MRYTQTKGVLFMKLFEVCYNNGEAYDSEQEFTELMVARDEAEAKEKAEVRLEKYWVSQYGDCEDKWCQVLREVTIVDGYEIKLEKVK
jgi:hypothetical protein